MSLYLFYTMVQKSQKWPKTQIKGGGGGPALNKNKNVTARAGEKKNSTGQPTSCSCRYCWTDLAPVIIVATLAEVCFKKKKKALDSKLWRKEHSIRTLLMIE